MKKFFIVLLLLPSTLFSREFILGTDLWQPFRIEDNGDLKGIDIEILNFIKKETGLKIIIKRAPWVRCLEGMKSGNIDLMLGLAKTEERRLYITYIEPSYYSVVSGFYIKNRDIEIHNYNDLNGLRIGYVNGSSYFPGFDADEELNKIPLPQETQLITMLIRNNLDTIIGTTIQIEYELKEKGLNNLILKTDYTPDYKIDLYLGISKKSELLTYRSKLENTLTKLLSEGLLDKIISKY